MRFSFGLQRQPLVPADVAPLPAERAIGVDDCFGDRLTGRGRLTGPVRTLRSLDAGLTPPVALSGSTVLGRVMGTPVSAP